MFLIVALATTQMADNQTVGSKGAEVVKHERDESMGEETGGRRTSH